MLILPVRLVVLAGLMDQSDVTVIAQENLDI